MKANELRIGNWLYHEATIDDHEPKQVKPGDIALISINSDSWLPVPLTEEWLNKFGFESREEPSNSYWMGEYRVWMEKTGRIFFYKVDDYRIELDGKYVHTLQNLYFALTGEELTINL